MAIQISPEIQARIAQMVDDSAYPDANAVLHEALSLLEQRERLLDLKRALAQGVQDVAEGRIREFTPERRERLWQQALSDPTPRPAPHDGA